MLFDLYILKCYFIRNCNKKEHILGLEIIINVFVADILFIDTLGSSNSYISTLRNYCKKIITLDDVTSAASKADVIINGILWAKKILPKMYGKAKVYQGVEYIFLRKF